MRIVLLLTLAASFGLAQSTGMLASVPTPSYVLCTFTGENTQVMINLSTDLVSWWNPSPSAYFPTFSRDCSIHKFADGYRVVFTTSAGTDHFGLCGPSTDLINWPACTTVSTTEITGAARSWGPEWFEDPADGVVHVIISVTTNSDWNACPPCFKIYEKHPVTPGDYSAWTDAVELSITGIGTENPLDPFVLAVRDSDNSPCPVGGKVACTYYLFWKAQSAGDAGGTGYNIGYATGGATLTAAYTLTQNGGGGSATWNWTGFPVYTEGPSLNYINGKWRLFADEYQNSFTLGNMYEIIFATLPFAGMTAPKALACPQQCKHGTIITY